MKREGTLRVTRGDEIEGAEPYEVKASSTVLNGGREETCLASAGNAPCAYPPRGCGGRASAHARPHPAGAALGRAPRAGQLGPPALWLDVYP